jgi:hypothetical protein
MDSEILGFNSLGIGSRDFNDFEIVWNYRITLGDNLDTLMGVYCGSDWGYYFNGYCGNGKH